MLARYVNSAPPIDSDCSLRLGQHHGTVNRAWITLQTQGLGRGRKVFKVLEPALQRPAPAPAPAGTGLSPALLTEAATGSLDSRNGFGLPQAHRGGDPQHHAVKHELNFIAARTGGLRRVRDRLSVLPPMDAVSPSTFSAAVLFGSRTETENTPTPGRCSARIHAISIGRRPSTCADSSQPR